MHLQSNRSGHGNGKSSRLVAFREANGRDANGSLKASGGRFAPLPKAPGGRFAYMDERLSRNPEIAAEGERKYQALMADLAGEGSPPTGSATSPAQAAPAAQASQGPNWAAVHLGASTAKANERDRWAKVLASPHAKGREGVCKTLLSAPQNWSAEHILRELPTLETDAELAARLARPTSQSTWARAWGQEPRATDAASPKPDASVRPADSVWSRAYAKQQEPAPAEPATKTEAKGGVWARAWAKQEAVR